MFDAFGKPALAAVLSAAQHARGEVGCAHLMWEVVKHDAVAAAARRLGADPDTMADPEPDPISRWAFKAVRSLRGRAAPRQAAFTPAARAALHRAVDIRRELDHPVVTLGILAVALIEDEGPTGSALQNRLPDAAEVRRELAAIPDPPDTDLRVAAHRVRLSPSPRE